MAKAARTDMVYLNPETTAVSAIMVTGKTTARYPLARQALIAFLRQNYPGPRELIIVNDNPVPLLSEGVRTELQQTEFPGMLPEVRVRELHVPSESGVRQTLGELRNLGKAVASYRYCLQWDDDDWSHPQRMLVQVSQTPTGGFSILRYEVHADLTSGRAFINDGASIRGGGFPGTMLWPKHAPVDFPAQGKAEDTEFVLALRAADIDCVVLRNDPLLYTRLYHGRNTWSQRHVMRRKPGSRVCTAAESAYVKTLLSQQYAGPAFTALNHAAEGGI